MRGKAMMAAGSRPLSRRRFHKTSISALAGVLSAASAERVLGAGERIQLGVIGCGGRGRTYTGIAAARARSLGAGSS